MIAAILYTSNSGFTREYAELLSEKTGLPAYNIQNSIPPAVRGQNVVYMGWLMAGNVQGFPKVRSQYNVRALCAVGMATREQDQLTEIKKRYGLTDTPAFYLQGGFDIHRLHGLYKLMMNVMAKKIRGDMEKLPERTPDQEALYQMATVGGSCVSEDNLAGVLGWYDTVKAG